MLQKKLAVVYALLLFASLPSMIPSALLAAAPSLTKDINPYPQDIPAIADMVLTGDLGFFAGYTPEHGWELWRSDRTQAGTFMVKDIAPGAESAYVTNLTAAKVGGQQLLFFSADDNEHGWELWRSDGTAAGTYLLKDIEPGEDGSSPERILAVEGGIVFTASTKFNGKELWISIGTQAGTKMVVDINPGPDSSDPSGMIYRSNPVPAVYFSANDGVNGRELWGSGGIGSTFLISDICAGPCGSAPAEISLNGTGNLLFRAYESAHGTELWISNGVPDSLGGDTHLIKDLDPAGSSSPSNFTNFAGNTFFSAWTATEGTELWRSDGTLPGTQLVKNINPGNQSANPAHLTVSGGSLFFTADDGSNGAELWKSDGSAAGTSLVKNIMADDGSPAISKLASAGGLLYFAAADGVNGRELWKSDGTAAGTAIIADIMAGPWSSIPMLIDRSGSSTGISFTAYSDHLGVWRTDGTSSGTIEEVDLSLPGRTSGAHPSELTAYRDNIFFSADDFVHGRELWKSDGSTAGTAIVKDITPFDAPAYPHELTVSGGTLFFSAGSKSPQGRELWKSDGTTGGTSLVLDIRAGSHGSEPVSLTNVNGTLFFSADDGINGRELWMSDGYAGHTIMVRDIFPGTGGSNPSELSAVGNRLFLAAEGSATEGIELWRSDGTEGGTHIVDDIEPGAGSSVPRNIVDLNGLALFSAATAASGMELWRSDGTPAGTYLVKDINPLAAHSSPEMLTAFGSHVYFFANDGTVKWLWRSDGSDAGTTRLKEVANGDIWQGLSTKRGFVPFHGKLLFAGIDAAYGNEPWVSDGTPAGTHVLKDIVSGTHDSLPHNFVVIEPYVFFEAYDDEHNLNLWRSDGTANGTSQLWRISDPILMMIIPEMTALNGRLFVDAFRAETGMELWSLLIDACPADSNKLTPGVCGCGSDDADLNSNGIIDCLGASELQVKIAKARALVKRLKIAAISKKRAAVRRAVKQLKALGRGMLSYVKTSSALIGIKDGVDLNKLAVRATKALKRARALHPATLRLDKKRAGTALNKLEAALDI